jgi:hypothetical protein
MGLTNLPRRLHSRLGVLFAVLRVMPAAQVALRVVLLTTGGVALYLAQGGWSMPGGLVVLVGVAALFGSLAAPESVGPGIAVGAAALAWLLRWGLHDPVPATDTVVLAVLVYLFHTTAALLAALPPAAEVVSTVLVRWYSRALGVSLLTVLFGLVAMLAGRASGGMLVDLLGLAGVVVLAAVPVLLTRRNTRRPGHD